MSQADDLLATLSVDYTDEPYITVNDDRTITVPDELKHIAVQGDHNIETVTVDCPRYWDEYDFSTMKVYINYMRPDGYKDSYRTKNLRVAEDDDTRILFDWTISGNVTAIKGNLSFLVYIESTKANPCWHSRLNQQMVIDEGLSATEQILRAPDSIEQVLAQTTASYIAEAKAEIEGKTAQSLASIPEDYTTVNNMAEEALREKANTIKMEAEGEVVTVNDSADNALLGLKLFGKTTQVSTTGRQMIPYPYRSTSNATDEVKWFINGDRSISVSGRASVQRWYALALYLPLTAGTYTISGCPSDGAYNKYWLYVQRKSDGYVWYDHGNGATFEVTADDSFDIAINLGPDAGSVTNLTFYPMLSSGPEVIPYEFYSGGFESPSPDWPQELVSLENSTVDVCGRNLLGLNGKYTSTYSSYILNALVDNGAITITGTSMLGYGTLLTSLPLGVFKKGETYRISRVGKNFHVGFWFYDADNINIGSLTTENSLAYTIPERADHISFFYAGVTPETEVNLTEKFMLNLGAEAFPWESHNEIQSVETTHTLPGIPVTSGGNYTDSDGQQWICDEIDFERGVHVQRIGRFTIDKSMTYFYNTDNHFLHTGSDLFDNVAAWETRILSTHFMPVGNGIDMYDYGWFQFNGNGGIRFRIEGIDSADALTTWLDTNSPEVIYPLVVPVETPLADAELASFKMVRSNYPSTTVLNDSGAHMAIKYAADTKTYVDNNALSTGTLVDTATGKAYRLAVTNGQLTVVAV